MKKLFLDTVDPHVQIPSDLPPKYLFSIRNKEIFLTGLNFYCALTPQSKLKKQILMHSYGIFHVLLKSGMIHVSDDSFVNDLRSIFERNDKENYFFNAYVPSYGKATIQVLQLSGSCQRVIKAAFDKKQQRSLEKEKDNLVFLKDYTFASFEVPRVLDSYQTSKMFVVEYTCPERYRPCERLDVSSKLSRLLSEMFSVGRQKELPLTESTLFLEIKERVELAGDDDMMRSFELLYKSLKSLVIPLGMVHYDFKPWNIIVNLDTNRPFIVDWELMRTDGFPLWDAYCYILFTYFTIHYNAHPIAALRYFYRQKNFFEEYARTLKIDLQLINKLLPLYLLDILAVQGLWNRWEFNESRPHKTFTSMKRFLLHICEYPLGAAA